jgi:hypothetical protein
LKNWTDAKLAAGKEMVMNVNPMQDLRYVRLDGTPDKIAEIEGYLDGKKIDRSKWRASLLFARYSRVRPVKAWQHSFVLDDIPKNSYLAIALNGEHGVEGAYAAIRVDSEPIGAPDRSVSFPANTWEYPVRKRSTDYTYYIPLTEDMAGKKIDAVVLGMKNGTDKFKPQVWITAYPPPFCEQILTLTEKGGGK